MSLIYFLIYFISFSRFKSEDPRWGGIPPAYSYVAIADGTKRKNFARIYAGWYTVDGPRVSRAPPQLSVTPPSDDQSGTKYTISQRKKGRVPILLIVKIGNEEERISSLPKPGNRGKRDSQVLLLSFLTKLLFDDRMTELEFDLFFKLYTITGMFINFTLKLFNGGRHSSIFVRDSFVCRCRYNGVYRLYKTHGYGICQGSEYHWDLRRDASRKSLGQLGHHDSG